MKVSFIGNGRVCRAFSAYLSGCGVTIPYRFGKNELYTDYKSRQINIQNIHRLCADSDIIFITTPDDTIAEVAEILLKSGADLSGKIVAHMSGSLTSGGLGVLLEKCDAIYSLHPMNSITGDPLDFSKVHHTLEGGGKNEKLMLELTDKAKITYTRIAAENKLLYHAASCICANYTVTLINIASKICQDIGFDSESAKALLMPMMRQVIENIISKGAPKALTGPISRGDINTLKKHLSALNKYGRYEDLYRIMGVYTADLSLCAGNITPERADEIRCLMRQE